MPTAEGAENPDRVVAHGYDLLGSRFAAWGAQNSPEVRTWFLGEVLDRLAEGSDVLELGCGPGTATADLSAGRWYVGIDLSSAQLAIARQRVPTAPLIRGDFTTIGFRPRSFDAVVAFYVFMHVPRSKAAPSFGRVFSWLRPGGRFMFTLTTMDSEDRVEEWLDVPMFFAGLAPDHAVRSLREVGFDIELFEIRDEVEDRYGPVDFSWVIARKPTT